MTAAKHKSEFKLTTDTPYLTLRGELRDVYCEDLGENWLHYNGTALFYGIFISFAIHVMITSYLLSFFAIATTIVIVCIINICMFVKIENLKLN